MSEASSRWPDGLPDGWLDNTRQQVTDDSLMRILDPDDTALLVIDMQNAFCHPEGGLARAGRNIESQRATIPHVRALVEAARKATIPIIWTIQEHLGAEDVASMKRRIPSHREKSGVAAAESWCVRNTWDAEIVDELKGLIRQEEHIIRKHRMSCFYSTTLDSLLRIRDIHGLIIAGVATNVCVESTIRDAYFRDLDIVVAADAVGGSVPELHTASLRMIDLYFGIITPTERIVNTLHSLSQKGVLLTD